MVFTGSEAQLSTLQQLNLLQTLYESIQNNGLQVDSKINKLIAVMCQGAHLQRVQLKSPSLTQSGLLPDFAPVRKSTMAANILANLITLLDTPMSFPANESLQAWIQQSNAGSEQEYVALLLCDTVPTPVKKPFHTVRFTGTTTLSANQLTQAFMTSEQQLPAGKYDCIGARMQTATGVFFRVGLGSWPVRPGGICVLADDSRDPDFQRYGNSGVWFTFQNTDQIVAEVMATAGDTAETLELDIVGPY